RPPVKDTPALINQRLDQAVRLPVILRLNVANLAAHVHVRVEPRTHRKKLPRQHRPVVENKIKKSLCTHLTRTCLPRYYSSAPKMNGSYLDSYAPLLL